MTAHNDCYIACYTTLVSVISYLTCNSPWLATGSIIDRVFEVSVARGANLLA